MASMNFISFQPCLQTEADWDVFQDEWETMYLNMDCDMWNIQPIPGVDITQDDVNTANTSLATLSTMNPLHQTYSFGADSPLSSPSPSSFQMQQYTSDTGLSPSSSSASHTSQSLTLTPSKSRIKPIWFSSPPNMPEFPSSLPPVYSCHHCPKSFEKKYLLK